MGFFRRYNELLKKYPYRTNMFTSGILMGVGDCTAQHFFYHEEKDGSKPNHDYWRTLRAWCYGAFFFSPLAVLWYGKTVPNLKNPLVSAFKRKTWSSKKVEGFDIAYRIGLDQLFVPGLVWIPLYNSVMTILSLEEDPFNSIRDKLQRNWWTVLTTNWKVWPIFQLISFTLIPVHLRVFASNICSIGWNCFLSTIHNSKKHYDSKFLETIHELDDSNINYS